MITKTKIIAAIICVLGLSLPAVAASPENGDLSSSKDEVTWSGEFFVSNPALCVSESDPTCDHFRLTISSPSIHRILIAIAPEEGYEEDDYDLQVYDDQGVLINSEASADGYESVVIENTGSSYYEVRVQPWFVTAGSRYKGVAMKTRERVIDVETNDCLELVPASVGVLDVGQVVELSVMLLLDGTDAQVAEEIMARAADSYAPLGINLVLVRTRNVSFSSTVSEDLIADAKAVVNGTPPKGIDLVGVFTTKEMQGSTGGTTVVGQADCIGGIRWDEHSFFVLSDIRDIEDPETGTTGTLASMGLNPNVDATAEVMAHEIGHVMGAHHHYANCAEGNLSSTGPGDLSPCSLMFNAVNFASIDFTALSGSVVRGHALDYASP